MLVISDLHWRTDCPSWRKESDYSKDVLRPMLGALLDMGEAICVAGDVFHRSANFDDTYDLFTFLKERNACIYATPGQHDMKYHNTDMESTGFNLLVNAGMIIPLGAEQIIEGKSVCGMGWGQDMPNVRPAHMLIAHVSVSHGDAVIPGATTATCFRQKASDYRQVFTGDNHKRFALKDGGGGDCGLYNAGCFHRMTSDLENQPPAAWHVLRDGKVELYEIPSPEPMIDLSYKMGREKGKKVAGVEFVNALSDARKHGGGDVFMETLKKAASEAQDQVKTLLDEVVQKCEEVQ